MTRLVVAVLLLPAIGFAQSDAPTNEEIQGELADLRKLVDKQSDELARLKASRLENEVNDYLEASQGFQPDGKPRAGYDGRFFVQTPDG